MVLSGGGVRCARSCKDISTWASVEYTIYTIEAFKRAGWVALDITGDVGQKRVAAKMNADRAAEGLVAITGHEPLTDEQRATLGLVQDGGEIPFDGTQTTTTATDDDAADIDALFAGMAGAR